MDILHEECDDVSIVQSFLHCQLPNIVFFTTVSKTNNI